MSTAAVAAMSPALRMSVVMPVLNEERRIAAALSSLLRVPGVHEVIIVDGGSDDGTRAIVAKQPAVILVHGPRGRGHQMNAGAHVASGDVLLFLHADVLLPPDALSFVNGALARPSVVAGAFKTCTVAEGPGPWWSPLLRLADIRSRYTRLPYGDQALFVRAEVFQEVGGFPAIELMEDLELSRRLRERGTIAIVQASVTVSGRRFLARPLFYTLVMNVFPMLYRLGVSPKTLNSLYGGVR